MQVAERQYTVEVLALTTKLLTENPEYYTIWNHRRRILESLFSDSSVAPTSENSTEQLVPADLQLTFGLLRQYPKCYWIWNHRNWTLRKGEALLDKAVARKLWTGELQLVSKMLHADNRNFHAWGYRRFVVSELERISENPASGMASPEHASLTESEFEYTTKMISSNLSNFSAWHNRSKLIPRLLNERGADSAARRKLLGDELELICSAINTDPFDQSIWYYHRFLLSTLAASCPQELLIVCDLSNQERQGYYEHEITYIKEILEDEADCKWIYETLLSISCSILELGDGNTPVTTSDMRDWLAALQRLDPLRKGRWNDLGTSLRIKEA